MPCSSKPPWQRTPPAMSGSAIVWSASSSASVKVTWSVVIGTCPLCSARPNCILLGVHRQGDVVTWSRSRRRRLLRREERQASILHGAAAAFARSGFAATSMEDVGRGVRRHQAHRVPPLRLQGGALPGDPPAGVRPAGRGARPRPRAPVRSPAWEPARSSPSPARIRPPSRCCGGTRRGRRSSPPTPSSCERCRCARSAT